MCTMARDDDLTLERQEQITSKNKQASKSVETYETSPQSNDQRW